MDKSRKWLADYNDIVSLYHNDSDRAAAILAASYLEHVLEDYLKSFLISDPSVDELFVGYGPLSSFSAKIGLAYGLRYITKLQKQDLTYIRKIRNHFAHHPFETSFTSSPVRDLCSNLSMSQPIPDGEGNLHQEKDPRLQFLFAVGMNIIMISEDQKKKKPPPK